jgi:putative ABC transport system permease protein
MIKHSFKLIWNQKKKNAWIILELFFLFLVLSISSLYLIEKYKAYNGGVGANVENVFYFNMKQKDYKTDNLEERLQLLRGDLLAIPGVTNVSYCRNSVPYIWSMSMLGASSDTSRSKRISTVERIGDEHFGDLLQLKIIAGKWYKDDYVDIHPPIVLDRKSAEHLYESIDNAIGKTIYLPNPHKVYGVYEFLKRNEYEKNYASFVRPLDQKSLSNVDIIVRFEEGAVMNTLAMSKTIHQHFNKEEYALRYASTMAYKKHNVLSETRVEIVMVVMVSIFLIVNIILGMVGIFGYGVKRRTAEIGVRRAMGANARNVNKLLLFESWALTLIGVIPALLLVIQIPILDLYPFETDVFIKGIVSSVLLVFVLVSLSVYYPARLAGKVKPAQALQEE